MIIFIIITIIFYSRGKIGEEGSMRGEAQTPKSLQYMQVNAGLYSLYFIQNKQSHSGLHSLYCIVHGMFGGSVWTVQQYMQRHAWLHSLYCIVHGMFGWQHVDSTAIYVSGCRAHKALVQLRMEESRLWLGLVGNLSSINLFQLAYYYSGISISISLEYETFKGSIPILTLREGTHLAICFSVANSNDGFSFLGMNKIVDFGLEQQGVDIGFSKLEGDSLQLGILTLYCGISWPNPSLPPFNLSNTQVFGCFQALIPMAQPWLLTPGPNNCTLSLGPHPTSSSLSNSIIVACIYRNVCCSSSVWRDLLPSWFTVSCILYQKGGIKQKLEFHCFYAIKCVYTSANKCIQRSWAVAMTCNTVLHYFVCCGGSPSWKFLASSCGCAHYFVLYDPLVEYISVNPPFSPSFPRHHQLGCAIVICACFESPVEFIIQLSHTVSTVKNSSPFLIETEVLASVFKKPASVTYETLFGAIKDPKSLESIRHHLVNGEYESAKSFYLDLKSVYSTLAVLHQISPHIWLAAQNMDVSSFTDDAWVTVVSLQAEKVENGDLENPLPGAHQLFENDPPNTRPLCLSDARIEDVLHSLTGRLTAEAREQLTSDDRSACPTRSPLPIPLPLDPPTAANSSEPDPDIEVVSSLKRELTPDLFPQPPSPSSLDQLPSSKRLKLSDDCQDEQPPHSSSSYLKSSWIIHVSLTHLVLFLFLWRGVDMLCQIITGMIISDPRKTLRQFIQKPIEMLISTIKEEPHQCNSLTIIDQSIYSVILNVKRILRDELPKEEEEDGRKLERSSQKASSICLQRIYNEVYKFDFTHYSKVAIKLSTDSDDSSKSLTLIDSLLTCWLPFCQSYLRTALLITLSPQPNQIYVTVSRYLRSREIPTSSQQNLFSKEVFRSASFQVHPIESVFFASPVIHLAQVSDVMLFVNLGIFWIAVRFCISTIIVSPTFPLTLKGRPEEGAGIYTTHFCRYGYNPILQQLTSISAEEFQKMMPEGYKRPGLVNLPTPLSQDELKVQKKKPHQSKFRLRNLQAYFQNRAQSDPLTAAPPTDLTRSPNLPHQRRLSEFNGLFTSHYTLKTLERTKLIHSLSCDSQMFLRSSHQTCPSAPPAHLYILPPLSSPNPPTIFRPIDPPCSSLIFVFCLFSFLFLISFLFFR
ncbi:hypothetical protein VP01_592g16 [Puccinia sorghi]|uniref:Bromo domain-containing protein n=1 Tax=Puccinia sorghi TaxID=27349 RepID=A0A0L6UJU5_9BASI|nr:hypothetical protein VP01_592g16 [Puccinia sorghi]